MEGRAWVLVVWTLAGVVSGDKWSSWAECSRMGMCYDEESGLPTSFRCRYPNDASNRTNCGCLAYNHTTVLELQSRPCTELPACMRGWGAPGSRFAAIAMLITIALIAIVALLPTTLLRLFAGTSCWRPYRLRRHRTAAGGGPLSGGSDCFQGQSLQADAVFAPCCGKECHKSGGSGNVLDSLSSAPAGPPPSTTPSPTAAATPSAATPKATPAATPVRTDASSQHPASPPAPDDSTLDSPTPSSTAT